MITTLQLAGFGREAAPDVLFTPETIFHGGDTGFFFDFTDANTLFSDTARTTPSTVGSQVRGVTDKSGTGRHLSTPSTTILRQQTGVGTDYLSFPGNVQGLSTTNGPLGSTTGYFAIAACRPTFQSAHLAVVDMDQSVATNPPVSQTLHIVNDSTVYALMHNTVASFFDADGGTVSNNTALVLSSLENVAGLTLDIRQNGTIVDTQAYTGTAARYVASAAGVIGASWLGSGPPSFRPFKGRIYAALVINRAPTAAEITNLEAWFAVRALT